jgi:hypothetical protein
MKFLTFGSLLLGFSAILLNTSCTDLNDDNHPNQNYPDVAFGIIANASPDSGDLYFFADNNPVNQSALTYPNADGIYTFYTGNRVLKLKNAAGTELATDTISLAAGNYFSAFAVNTFNNLQLVTYRDTLVQPANNHARIRFINLSPDSESVNVSSAGETLSSGLEFKEASPFIEVETGIYNFDFTTTSTSAALYTQGPVELHAGHIYTVFTKGFVTPATGSNETFSTEIIRNY